MNNLINRQDAAIKWIPALSDEWGWLPQGNDAGVSFIDTTSFISYS